MKYPQLVSVPSAVSNWLEEQLEARGIDSIVYTRYILSLFHRDSTDIIFSEQDLHFTYSDKEVRKSGSGRKRFRRSNENYEFVQADLDQLKRTAAVECLKSASDQKCGIESLVDELCLKLQEADRDSLENIKPIDEKNESRSVPQDPAKQYYAAFPPLTGNNKTGSPSTASLIPKWLSSPKKKGIRKQSKSFTYGDKFHARVDQDCLKARSVGRQRLNYIGRNKKDLGFRRNMAKSVERSEGAKDFDRLVGEIMKNQLKKSSKLWVEEEAAVLSEDNVEMKETEQCLDTNEEVQSDDTKSMFDDLVGHIHDLLNSPEPQVDPIMNVANVRETGKNKFIQCGTNITSSIWSNNLMENAGCAFDNTYNAAVASNQADMMGVGLKLSSISISKQNKWAVDEVNIAKQNENNDFLERSGGKSSQFGSHMWDLPFPSFIKHEKWSEPAPIETEMQKSFLARSYVKLNHQKSFSSFCEVEPCSSSFTAFGKNSSIVKIPAKRAESEKDKEDLLTSSRTHFKPIGEDEEEKKKKKERQPQYENGTTFVIPSNLDKVVYKRSSSGFLCVETEYGVTKKYLEYKNCSSVSSSSEFTVKFNMNRNNKACQTDFENDLSHDYIAFQREEIQSTVKRVCSMDDREFYFPGDDDVLDENEEECKCKLNIEDDCPIHTCRPSSLLAELMWKCETEYCANCNKKSCDYITQWDKKSQSVSNIWNGEICETCLRRSRGQDSLSNKQQRTLLREDIHHDGEQLLSDIRSVQQNYMDSLPVNEVTVDITELMGNQDRKRRHSNVAEIYQGLDFAHRGSWSFESRLKEDCLLKMSTIQTLRSVTL